MSVITADMVSPFVIDILDASGNKLAAGPLTTVLNLDTTQKLDSAGEVAFTVPAADKKTEHIVAGVQFDIWDEVDGYLGRFIFKSKSIDESNGQALMQVAAWDLLRELAWTTVGFRRVYAVQLVEDIIADLFTVVPAWTATVEAGLASTSASYEGESVLRAVDQLIEAFGIHFRIGDAVREIDIGSFGAASGVRLFNYDGVTQAVFDAGTETAIVSSISEMDEGDELWNRIIGLGAGDGDGQVTMEGATLGTFTLENATNKDGSLYFFIEDAASVAASGRRTKIVTFNNIRPISNSAVGKTDAADAVKLAAEAFITRHLTSRVEYRVNVRALRQPVKVGDTVRLVYRGRTENYNYLNVDSDFIVLGIAKSRQASGNRNTQLTISTVDTPPASATAILDVLRTVDMMQVHIQPAPFWSENTYYDFIQNIAAPGEPDKDAEFKLEIDDSMLKITKVRIRFKTRPLYTYTFPRLPDNTTTNFTSVPPNNHTHTIPRTPNEQIFKIAVDDQHPSDVELHINGIDVSAAHGGPWAVATNVAIDIAADITDEIVDAIGGLYQDHTIVIKCGIRTGNINTPLSILIPITGDASHGEVEMNIRVQGIAQSIVPA